MYLFFFFFQAEDGIRDYKVTGVQTCALPISAAAPGCVAAAQGGAVLPGGEQAPRARELRTGARDPVDQVSQGEPTMLNVRNAVGLLIVVLALALLGTAQPAVAASAAEIDRDVDNALGLLFRNNTDARQLSERARGVLVFPD